MKQLKSYVLMESFNQTKLDENYLPKMIVKWMKIMITEDFTLKNIFPSNSIILNCMLAINGVIILARIAQETA